MLQAFKLEFVGKHHSGIDDCRSIIQIVKTMLQLGFKFEQPIFIPEDYNHKEDPNFQDFGSVTEPNSWKCPSCEIWNRPWTKSCQTCDFILPRIIDTQTIDEFEDL